MIAGEKDTNTGLRGYFVPSEQTPTPLAEETEIKGAAVVDPVQTDLHRVPVVYGVLYSHSAAEINIHSRSFGRGER
jgi:hypothetical protein